MTRLKTVEDCIPYASWPNHSLYDAKSLALHSRIAWKISQDPGLLNKARKNLRRRRDNYDPDALPPFIEKWERLLAQPAQELAAFLVAVTDAAVSLRHFSPFARVLSEEERQSILDAFAREIRCMARDVIDLNPDIMIGTPVFTGTRVPVQSLRDHLAGGYTLGYFLAHFPTVSREQATQLLDLAAETLMAEAGYEPLKDKGQDERPDNAACRVININPKIMSGTPVFRGTRLPVRTLTDNLMDGYGLDFILENYPTLSRDQAVLFIRLGQKLTDYVL